MCHCPKPSPDHSFVLLLAVGSISLFSNNYALILFRVIIELQILFPSHPLIRSEWVEHEERNASLLLIPLWRRYAAALIYHPFWYERMKLFNESTHCVLFWSFERNMFGWSHRHPVMENIHNFIKLLEANRRKQCHWTTENEKKLKHWEICKWKYKNDEGEQLMWRALKWNVKRVLANDI